MYIVEGVRMKQQVRNLNCGRFCLEALMLWRHGSRFGRVPHGYILPTTIGQRTVSGLQYGGGRVSHSRKVSEHINKTFAIGFQPESCKDDYGLVQLPHPTNAAEWEEMLRSYGPIIASGCIGAVEVLERVGAGHYVLVIGIDDTTDELIYLDPLGSVGKGGLAFFTGAKTRDPGEERRYNRAALELKLNGEQVLVACVPISPAPVVVRLRGG
jgi:hypothetical protein